MNIYELNINVYFSINTYSKIEIRVMCREFLAFNTYLSFFLETNHMIIMFVHETS